MCQCITNPLPTAAALAAGALRRLTHLDLSRNYHFSSRRAHFGAWLAPLLALPRLSELRIVNSGLTRHSAAALVRALPAPPCAERCSLQSLRLVGSGDGRIGAILLSALPAAAPHLTSLLLCDNVFVDVDFSRSLPRWPGLLVCDGAMC